jgi:hypothetical protein
MWITAANARPNQISHLSGMRDRWKADTIKEKLTNFHFRRLLLLRQNL